jgi:hypothetical protein
VALRQSVLDVPALVGEEHQQGRVPASPLQLGSCDADATEDANFNVKALRDSTLRRIREVLHKPPLLVFFTNKPAGLDNR